MKGPVKSYDDVLSAVEVLRKALVAQEDKSVVISSIGMTTNMRDLVKSPSDQYSDLSGYDLIDKKVKQVVWMDGGYNFACAAYKNDKFPGFLGDDDGCRGSAQKIFELWPNTVEHIFNPTAIGDKVHTGSIMTDCLPIESPCRKAYFDWGKAVSGKGDHFDRNSWDLINTMFAVRGVNHTYLNQTTYEQYSVDVSGKPETWSKPSSTGMYNKLEYFLENKTEAVEWMEREINTLLCQGPKKETELEIF
jgi:hypothetical protein